MTFVTKYVPSAHKAIRDGCPDRLAVVATLFGLEPAAPERCRVLEIGCAEGVHLVPLAELAPESAFRGVDLDARAVEAGNATIASLGLRNLTLECGDFRTLSIQNERFDAIVVQGVYSWVPRETRDALLSFIEGTLGDRGVAFISFNALPGGHARHLVRELVLPHVRSLADPHERVARAREVVGELLRMPPQPGSSLALLRSELELFARASDSLVHHDYLAETNENVGLASFVEHLAQHGLEYVSDAATLDRSPFGEHPLVTAETVHASELERIAYVDRLEMRRFRQAVVRKRRDPAPRFDLGRAGRLWFASSAEPAARGDVQGAEPVSFKTVAGLELKTNVPDAKLALYELGRVWPQALRLDDLAERVAERLGSSPNIEKLAKLLLDSGGSAATRAFFRPPACLRAPSRLPKTTALARLDAGRGIEMTNVHHEPVKLDVPFNRALLALLDGTRDREALARELCDAIEAGRVAVPGIDPKVRSRWESLIPREVDAGIERIARFALLVA
ncbi:MAG TPA: class I SAM-dependent methyltransferase [Polyangiaceae bacterium]|nr:class I SAM-dependent methyltransferase [Polyangiaceae bacterium]